MDTLIEHDLLDEFCGDLCSDAFVAGSAKRIAAGPGHVIRMTRAHLISDGDGYVYARPPAQLTGPARGIARWWTCVAMVPYVAAATLTALLTGCAPWLAANPQFASDSAHNAGSGSTTAKPSDGPPPSQHRRRTCCGRTAPPASSAMRGHPHPRVTLECSNYDADLDPINGAAEH